MNKCAQSNMTTACILLSMCPDNPQALVCLLEGRTKHLLPTKQSMSLPTPTGLCLITGGKAQTRRLHCQSNQSSWLAKACIVLLFFLCYKHTPLAALHKVDARGVQEQKSDLSHAVMQLWPRQCRAISKPYSTAKNTALLQSLSSSTYATNKPGKCCRFSRRLRNQDLSSGHHLPAARSVLTLRAGKSRPAGAECG